MTQIVDSGARYWLPLVCVAMASSALSSRTVWADEPKVRAADVPSTAILSPEGAAALVKPLGVAISGPAWLKSHRGRAVIGPRQLSERLAKVPVVSAALAAARLSLARAEEAALHMKRSASLSAARRALKRLRAVGARHHARSLVARAYVAEGIARLLHPAESKAAQTAFARAYAVDPHHRVDPEKVPTRTARILRLARSTKPALDRPTTNELAKLASWAGVDELVWVSARVEGKSAKLVTLSYQREQRVLLERQRILPLEEAMGEKLSAAVSAIALAPRASAAPFAASQRSATAPPRVPLVPSSSTVEQPSASGSEGAQSAKSWYQRWWVWTLVGAVAAGSAAAIVVVATAETKDNYTFTFTR